MVSRSPSNIHQLGFARHESICQIPASYCRYQIFRLYPWTYKYNNFISIISVSRFEPHYLYVFFPCRNKFYSNFGASSVISISNLEIRTIIFGFNFFLFLPRLSQTILQLIFTIQLQVSFRVTSKYFFSLIPIMGNYHLKIVQVCYVRDPPYRFMSLRSGTSSRPALHIVKQ